MKLLQQGLCCSGFFSPVFMISSFCFFCFWKPKLSSLGQGLDPFSWDSLLGFGSEEPGLRGGEVWGAAHVEPRLSSWQILGGKCLATQMETPQGAPCPLQRLRGSWFWNSEKCSSAAGFWIKDVMQLTAKSFPLYDNSFILFPLVFVRRIHLDSQKQWLFINIVWLEATEKQTESDIVIWRR